MHLKIKQEFKHNIRHFVTTDIFKEINIMYNLRNMTRDLDDLIVYRDLKKGRCCPKFHEFNAKKVTLVYRYIYMFLVKFFCIKMQKIIFDLFIKDVYLKKTINNFIKHNCISHRYQ